MKYLGVLVLGGAFILTSSSKAFTLDNYTTKYKDNDPVVEVHKKVEKEIAKKRFALSHTAKYYYVMGNRLKEKGELRKALQNYEYAIFLAPLESGDYYKALAEIYYFIGQFQESIAYLQIGLTYPFSYGFDRMKALYLLITNYFRLGQDQKAIESLLGILKEYQEELDRQAINGLNIKYEYYAPAFFLLALYYRNHKDFINHAPLFQKALQLGFKSDFTSYFLYELYNEQGQSGISLEYLKRAKQLNPQIDIQINRLTWVKTYDLYREITEK